MPAPRVEGAIVALGAGTNDETNLPWADSIIFAPVRLAAWRQELTLSVVLFLAGMAGIRKLNIEARAHSGAQLLTTIHHDFDRDDAEHHWLHVRIGFPAEHAGVYRLSATISLEGADSLEWSQELVVERG